MTSHPAHENRACPQMPAPPTDILCTTAHLNYVTLCTTHVVLTCVGICFMETEPRPPFIHFQHPYFCMPDIFLCGHALHGQQTPSPPVHNLAHAPTPCSQRTPVCQAFECGQKLRRTEPYTTKVVGRQPNGKLDLDVPAIRARQEEVGLSGSLYVPPGPHHFKVWMVCMQGLCVGLSGWAVL